MVATNLINTIIGDFRLIDFLGAGGMGEVYRAVNLKTGQVAAVKVLTKVSEGANLLERFFNEARIHASLLHPNIPRFYAFHDCNGMPCIVMEYVDGNTLAETITARGRLGLSEASYLFQAIVEAVGYIHSQGIIHRDLKASNVKISSTGQVKLLDFGIAKGSLSPDLTQTNGVVGTLQYLSPEQLNTGVADVRSDIWELGIILYEMFTGQVPFEATTIGKLSNSISKGEYIAPTRLNQLVPREVENIIARCLKKKPQDRYQSTSDLLHDLSRLAATVAVHEFAQVEDEKPRWQMPQSLKTYWPTISIGATSLLFILFGFSYFAAAPATKVEVQPLPSPTIQLQASKTQTEPLPSPSSSPAPSPSPQLAEIEGVTTRIVADDTLGQLSVSLQTAAGERTESTPLEFKAKPGDKIIITAHKEGREDYVVPLQIGTQSLMEFRINSWQMKKKN